MPGAKVSRSEDGQNYFWGEPRPRNDEGGLAVLVPGFAASALTMCPLAEELIRCSAVDAAASVDFSRSKTPPLDRSALTGGLDARALEALSLADAALQKFGNRPIQFAGHSLGAPTVLRALSLSLHSEEHLPVKYVGTAQKLLSLAREQEHLLVTPAGVIDQEIIPSRASLVPNLIKAIAAGAIDIAGAGYSIRDQLRILRYATEYLARQDKCLKEGWDACSPAPLHWLAELALKGFKFKIIAAENDPIFTPEDLQKALANPGQQNVLDQRMLEFARSIRQGRKDQELSLIQTLTQPTAKTALSLAELAFGACSAAYSLEPDTFSTDEIQALGQVPVVTISGWNHTTINTPPGAADLVGGLAA